MYYFSRLFVDARQKITTLILIVISIVLCVGLWHMPLEPHVSTYVHAKHLETLTTKKHGYEVFGFAPYWTMNSLQNVDFSVLSTLSYFSVDILPDGSLNTNSQGYASFESQNATDLFTKAHDNGTRVVLTLTQMDESSITSFLDNPLAQAQAINNTISVVKARGIDGVNVDFEYIGDPGSNYRDEYVTFIDNLTKAVHGAIPSSQVSVSVLATSAKDPTLYDIASLSKSSDEIFLMAYDFGNLSSTSAMPTSPLYGYKNGIYWYDVSTAVQDFLAQMPASKLVLGVPWYSYNYAVSQPQVNAQTINSYWTSSQVQTYATASADPTSQAGWDTQGQVGWKAYYDNNAGTWRMVFIEDAKSLGLKYNFAKDDHLAGIGIWALGFDTGSNDMWTALRNAFGIKIADANVEGRIIQN